MTKRRSTPFAIIVLLVLVACKGIVPTGVSTPRSQTIVVHETIEEFKEAFTAEHTPFIGVSPTFEILLTSTAVPSLTSTPPLFLKYEQVCFSLSDNFGEWVQMEMNLLLDGRDFNNPVALLGKDGQIRSLEVSIEPGWKFVSASPNRLLFAIKLGLTSSSKSELQVLDLQHNIIARFDWESNWRQIAGWLNDQQVVISVKNDDHAYDSSLVIDIISGERKLIPPMFPNLNPLGVLEPMFTWAGNTYTGMYLHPTLQFVIYPSIRKNGGVSLSRIPENFIFDRAKSYELAYLHGDTGYYPEWSPDGSALAVFNHPPEYLESTRDQKELFLINLDGQIRQLTNFNQDEYRVEMRELSWSPDGKKIAFLMFYLDDTSYKENYPDVKVSGRLVILDLLSNTVMDTCVPGDTKPIWSEDGRFIAVTSIYKRSSPTKGHMYVADLKNRATTIIIDDYVAEAWIVEK